MTVNTGRLVTSALFIVGALLACAEPSAPKYSPAEGPQSALEAASSRFQVVAPGYRVTALPSVRYYRPRDGTGIQGQEVVFIVEHVNGVRTNVQVTTDAAGVATLPEWQIGQNLGVYSVTAIVGSNRLVFRAVIPGEIVAIYDLKQFDNTPLPQYGIDEDHYVLYEGGVFNQFTNEPVQPFTGEPTRFGKYELYQSQISFSVEQSSGAGWMRSPGTGEIAGRDLRILRGHPLDFPVELHVRR